MTCHTCRYIFDEFEAPHYINGLATCKECTPMCTFCGEWLDDHDPNHTPLVKYRQFEVDGKLSNLTHADCAGDWLLSVFANKAGLIGASDLTQEQITEIVEKAFQPELTPLELAWRSTEVMA